MAPWCGHCQKLKPEWEEAAKKLAGDFKLGIVDATQESSLAQKYDVKVLLAVHIGYFSNLNPAYVHLQGYPTIKHFKVGANGKKEAVDYNGARIASDIVQFAEARLEQAGASSPIPEIVKTVCNSSCSSSLGCLRASDINMVVTIDVTGYF